MKNKLNYKKILIIVVSILLIVLLGLGVFGIFYIKSKLNKINYVNIDPGKIEVNNEVKEPLLYQELIQDQMIMEQEIEATA